MKVLDFDHNCKSLHRGDVMKHRYILENNDYKMIIYNDENKFYIADSELSLIFVNENVNLK